MIDAALFTAAAAGAQPAAPEAATPEGFGDVLSAMLAGAAGAAGGAGAQGAKGDTAETQETQPAQTAGVVAELLTALREAAGRMPKGVTNRGGQTTEQPTEAEDAEAAAQPADTPVELEAPRETDGKAASAAWHASAQALAHVPAWAAPMLSVAPAAEGVTPDTGDAETAEIGDGPVLEQVAARTETLLDETVVPDVAANTAETVTDAGTAPESTPDAGEQRAQAADSRGQAALTGQDTQAAEATEVAGAQTPAQMPQAAQRREQRAEIRVGQSTAIGGGEAAAAPADVAPQGSAPVQSIGAGVLQRVLDAIDLAQHRPPPNTMAVDLPGEAGEEAVRLLVTVRGETVQVSGGPGDQGLPPGWARPLADALAERGMNLAGFGAKDRGQGRDDEPRPGEQGRASRAPRRTIPTDDGALRL